MELPPSSGLSEDAKDRIISEQAAMISQLARRISELEKLVGKPKKTSKLLRPWRVSTLTTTFSSRN